VAGGVRSAAKDADGDRVQDQFPTFRKHIGAEDGSQRHGARERRDRARHLPGSHTTSTRCRYIPCGCPERPSSLVRDAPLLTVSSPTWGPTRLGGSAGAGRRTSSATCEPTHYGLDGYATAGTIPAAGPQPGCCDADRQMSVTQRRERGASRGRVAAEGGDRTRLVGSDERAPSPPPATTSPRLEAASRAIPAKARLALSLTRGGPPRHEPKRIHDAIRMATFNAESTLARCSPRIAPEPTTRPQLAPGDLRVSADNGGCRRRAPCQNQMPFPLPVGRGLGSPVWQPYRHHNRLSECQC
jgi:hypothetical protein